jgi:DNA polymerase-1
MPRLSSGSTDTSVIFGFVRAIASYRSQFKPDKVAIAWDGRNSLRKQTEPSYKANRIKNKEFDSLFVQMDAIKQDFSLNAGLGFVEMAGFEADDIIAGIVAGSSEEHIIISSDTDLLQLLTDRVSVYNFKKLVNEASFRQEFGFPPNLYFIYKALTGDPSDNIKGVAGIGKKRARELVSASNFSISNLKSFLDERDSWPMFQSAINLIYLPYRDMFGQIPVIIPGIDVGSIVDKFYKYQIYSVSWQEFSGVPMRKREKVV